MRAEELWEKMIQYFFMITAGIVVSMYVFCRIFYPDASFTTDDIGRILLMAAASDLPMLIFLSRRELDKKQMLLRKGIHFIVLSAILLYFAFLWEWVNPDNSKEIAVFLLSVLAVYFGVLLLDRYRHQKLTDKLNDRLAERYRPKT